MIYQLLFIILLIILVGATAPVVTEKTFDRKKKVKQLVTAKLYPKDILKGECK